MKPSSFNDHVVDVMEEPVEFTTINRGVSDDLASRHSERKKAQPGWKSRVPSTSHRR